MKFKRQPRDCLEVGMTHTEFRELSLSEVPGPRLTESEAGLRTELCQKPAPVGRLKEGFPQSHHGSRTGFSLGQVGSKRGLGTSHPCLAPGMPPCEVMGLTLPSAVLGQALWLSSSQQVCPRCYRFRVFYPSGLSSTAEYLPSTKVSLG